MTRIIRLMVITTVLSFTMALISEPAHSAITKCSDPSTTAVQDEALRVKNKGAAIPAIPAVPAGPGVVAVPAVAARPAITPLEANTALSNSLQKPANATIKCYTEVIEYLFSGGGFTDGSNGIDLAHADSMANGQTLIEKALEDALIEALKHPDPDVQKSAANTLDKIVKKKNSVVDRIMTTIVNGDLDNLISLSYALKVVYENTTSGAELKTKILDKIVSFLKDKDSNIHDSAAETLGKIAEKNSDVIDLIMATLFDGRPDNVTAASSALKIIYDNTADGTDLKTRILDKILASLKNEDINIRGGVAFALGKVFEGNSNKNVLDALGERLKDKKEEASIKSTVNTAIEDILQDPVASGILIDELSESSTAGKTDYSTKLFYINAGIATLNPYKISPDPVDPTKFVIADSGETESRPFVELYFRHRNAWLGEEHNNHRYETTSKGKKDKLRRIVLPDDYEFRIGYSGFREDDGSTTPGSTISGAGDAYGEMSFGYNLTKLRSTEDSDIWSNIEFLYGLTTDRNSQKIHHYLGAGIATVGGFDISVDVDGTFTPRRLEFLAGAYYGEISVPNLKDTDSREVKSHNGYPAFETENTIILRGDVHVPITERGYITLAGRFYDLIDSDAAIDPWSISLGITFEIERLGKSIADLTDSILP